MLTFAHPPLPSGVEKLVDASIVGVSRPPEKTAPPALGRRIVAVQCPDRRPHDRRVVSRTVCRNGCCLIPGDPCPAVGRSARLSG
jgi:hypothetical protein